MVGGRKVRGEGAGKGAGMLGEGDGMGSGW